MRPLTLQETKFRHDVYRPVHGYSIAVETPERDSDSYDMGGGRNRSAAESPLGIAALHPAHNALSGKNAKGPGAFKRSVR